MPKSSPSFRLSAGASTAARVLLWDVWGKVDAAREVIGTGEPIGADALRGFLG